MSSIRTFNITRQTKQDYARSYSFENGQAMIETILSMSILILSAFAIMQIGHLIYAKSHINHAGFIAARAASMMEIKPIDILDSYRKALGKFSENPVQLELMPPEQTSEGIWIIQLHIIQGYSPRFPFIKSILLHIFAKHTPISAFEKILLAKQQLPIHTEIALPLPPHIPAYPAIVLSNISY